MRVLINERRAAQYAAREGLEVVTVPSVIVALRGEDLISDRAARRKLDLIESITARQFATEARHLLDILVRLP